MWGQPPSAVRRTPVRLFFSADISNASGALNSRSQAVPTHALLYHVAVHSLAQRLLEHVRRHELLRAGDRVGVAVSGGIDSVALLRLLLELRSELGIVLSVVHFNHKLRGAESDADEHFVADLACSHGLEFHSDSDDVADRAREESISVEAAARELRYGFFESLLGEETERDPQGLKPNADDDAVRGPEGPLFHGPPLDKIATGHTLDDQAETVLMRLIRGSGLRGLGGIYPRLSVEEDDGEIHGEIVRPLLAFRRRELEPYLNDIGQGWREDATNADGKFTRNRVRKLVMPLLEKEFNPSVAQNLAELAEIARGEEDYWENEVAGWMGTAVHWSEPSWARKSSLETGLVQIGLPVSAASLQSREAVEALQSRIDQVPWLVSNASVDRLWFLGESAAVQRRVVKAVGERAGIPLGFKHVEEIVRFAVEEGGRDKELSLPLGWKVLLETDALVFATPDLREAMEPQDYEYDLPIPTQLVISEILSRLETRRVSPAEMAGYNPQQLLDADSLPGPLRVRNWRAGDRFWPNHTKSPKKIKELLQELHVPQPDRKQWPVVVSADQIVWMRGFAAPARLCAKPGRDAVAIVETSLSVDSDR
jgi:tRNA(Ile)-lysidine synthase